jgi:hypothetical protein
MKATLDDGTSTADGRRGKHAVKMLEGRLRLLRQDHPDGSMRLSFKIDDPRHDGSTLPSLSLDLGPGEVQALVAKLTADQEDEL